MDPERGHREAKQARWAATMILVAVVLLLTVGVVMLYSVTYQAHGFAFVKRQLIAVGLGMLVAAVILVLPYSWIKWLGVPAYLLSVALLVAVLLVGREVKGAVRWIRLHDYQFQPSDFAKLALILGLSWYYTCLKVRIQSFVEGVLVPSFITALICGLILLEPDLGTAMLIGAVGMIIIWGVGAWKRYLFLMALVGILGISGFILHDEVRYQRIMGFIHPHQMLNSINYQTHQSKIAIGLGGWTGRGLGKSQQVELLPEARHDFIFAILAEEWGFLGGMMVLVLYALLFWGAVRLSAIADPFGSILCWGIGFLFGLQAIINLGVVTGLLPNKGLPLIFISQGGSSVLMGLIGVGLLLRVARAICQSGEKKQSVGPTEEVEPLHLLVQEEKA